MQFNLIRHLSHRLRKLEAAADAQLSRPTTYHNDPTLVKEVAPLTLNMTGLKRLADQYFHQQPPPPAKPWDTVTTNGKAPKKAHTATSPTPTTSTTKAKIAHGSEDIKNEEINLLHLRNTINRTLLASKAPGSLQITGTHGIGNKTCSSIRETDSRTKTLTSTRQPLERHCKRRTHSPSTSRGKKPCTRGPSTAST